MQKELLKLEEKYNSNQRESNRLLELCNGDLSLLNTLYEKMKVNFVFNVPCDKEQVLRVLNNLQPNKSF